MKRSHQAFATPDTQAPGVSPHQVSALLSTCSILYRDSRALIGRIRGSLGVMQGLRSELRHRAQPLNGNAGGRGAAHLQFEYGLTTREAEVALLISQGCSNTAIASALHISTHTARHHTQRVLAKLGVHSRAAAGAAIRR
jgi:DNA-binding NarL/FixJ family response regulator